MKKALLLIVAAVFIMSNAGCAVVEEREALADSFPDKYWEDVWVITERESDIMIDDERALMEAYCQVEYQGEEPAEDVKIIIRSPLTYDFISEESAQRYGTVEPGEKLEYHLQTEYQDWDENVPVYVFAEKISDDFRENYYVGISWRYGEEEFSKQFFDWSKEK